MMKSQNYFESTVEDELEYFKNLGITAVELLPVHAFVDDKPLVERGLTVSANLKL